MKSKKKKGFTIAEFIVIGVVLISFLVFLIIEMAAPASSVGEWVKENVWDTEKAGKDFMSHLPTLMQSIIYVVVITKNRRSFFN